MNCIFNNNEDGKIIGCHPIHEMKNYGVPIGLYYTSFLANECLQSDLAENEPMDETAFDKLIDLVLHTSKLPPQKRKTKRISKRE